MRLSEIFGWDGALQKRFWSSIEKDGDCWNWKQHIYENGYGRIIVRHNGKKRQLGAHRIAYLLVHFEVPDDLEVCHSCDNRKCVNPKHLWVGSQADNMQDAVKKGRHVPPLLRREQHPQAKLTQEDVDEIRATYQKRTRYNHGNISQLVNKFGISDGHIHNILARRVWP
jgi:hypothetical protein